jgi:geranylgeranyl pyrophosphate synthase
MMTDSPSATELDSVIARIAHGALVDVPSRLVESILYSLLGPGKRIRPRLVYAVGRALALSPEITGVLAAAIEMVHAYTLVHDDLPAMDDDDFRRGRPTNHKVYGEGLAVLAGDSLALLGPDVLLRLRGKIPAEKILALIEILVDAAGARGVIAGQASEMDPGSTRSITGLFEVFRLKTGALFRASLTLPAVAAGADAATVTAIAKVGDDLGIAFQIADDLEDDFAAKKSDPGHTAAYLDASAARIEAVKRLRISSSLPAELQAALAPFLAELGRKIEGTST